MNLKKIFASVGEKAKNLFSNKKKIVATCAVAATLAAGVFGLQANKSAVAEGTPRFNFLQGDAEMLQVAKTTDSNWGDPLNANVGDRVAFLFYYHNGMINTTAHNTRLRVDLPIDQGTALNMKSYLWSDETPYITDTIVDGQIVGASGATINLPTDARIQYVPGSTMIFRNGATAGTQIADGITTNSGVNIGDIQGCWNYSGYVTFLADIYGQSNLSLVKKVAHPGETTWHDEITANPGDSVAYRLSVRNDGDITAASVTLNDTLPQYMTYETGTTYYYTGAHPEGIKMSDTLFTTGISIPDVAVGDGGVTYVSYRSHIDASVPSGSWELINTAKVFQSGIQKGQDQAKVIVIATRGLILDKKVSNGVSWVEQNTAKLGDTITYRIIVRNTGNVAVNSVAVKDTLPVFVNYIAGSTKVDGAVVGDQIITASGLSVGNLAPGAQKTITLQGKVFGCPPLGNFDLVNTASTWASGVSAIFDTAITVVNTTTPTAPIIR